MLLLSLFFWLLDFDGPLVRVPLGVLVLSIFD
jgi:hypothetical protein